MNESFFSEFGDAITFASATECVPDARQIAWRPASFQDWRQQGCEERHIISVFVRWWFSHDATYIKTPLTVARLGGRDEPDFLLTEGGQSYGVEVAQATTQRLQSATNRLMKSKSTLYLELGPELNIEHDSIRVNPSQWLRAKGDRFTSEGWIGMEPERQWAEVCMRMICQKLCRLRDHYCKTHPSCDLLLYSNTHTPLVDLADAVQFLKTRAETCLQIARAPVLFRSVNVVAENWVVFDALGDNPKIATKEGWPFGE